MPGQCAAGSKAASRQLCRGTPHEIALPRRRPDRVVNWNIWESWGISMLPMNVGKTDCYYPKEQVSLFLQAALGSFARVACWAKGRERCLG